MDIQAKQRNMYKSRINNIDELQGYLVVLILTACSQFGFKRNY